MNLLNPNQFPDGFPYEMPKRTVAGLLWSKCLDTIEKTELSDVVRIGGGLCATALLTAAFNYTGVFVEVGKNLISFQDFLPLKCAVSFAIVFSYRRILDNLKRFFTKKQVSAESIEGIPTAELLDHLFTYETFKRKDIEEKFKIPRYRFDALGKKLDALGVTVHGENNARILNKAFSRQDVANILKGKKGAGELVPALMRVAQNEWTSEPTAKRIEERVQGTLSKGETITTPPIFTLRPLR